MGKLVVGLDVGTMTLVRTKSDDMKPVPMRNVFLKIDLDEVDKSSLSEMSHVEDDSNNVAYIIGEDAYRFGNIFGKEISRPMKQGMISPEEIDAIDILTLMIGHLLGDISNKEVYCNYSVPGEPIDTSRSIIYHEKVWGRILGSLGINHKPLNEAMAIIYDNLQDTKYTGIGVSFGAGMCNCAISFKGVQVSAFSTTKAGDWVDKSVADSLNLIPNRVTSIKEKNLDLSKSFAEISNKRTRRVVEALEYYYTNMVQYAIKNIVKKFNQDVDIDIDEQLPVVVAGGTSLPEGFIEIVKEQILKSELPFEVSDVTRAKKPFFSVSLGLVKKGMLDLSIPVTNDKSKSKMSDLDV